MQNIDEHHVYGGYRGECTDCGVTTKAYKTREEAVNAWNMRNCGVCDDTADIECGQFEEG